MVRNLFIKILPSILLFLLLVSSKPQDSDVTDLYTNLSGLEKIDSLNAYGLQLGRKEPKLRMQIGNESYKLSQKENYQFGKMESLYNIGAAYFHLVEHDSALAYYKKGNKYAVILNDTEWKMNFATNIGQVFSDKYQFDSANFYYKKGLENAKLINDSLAIGYLYQSIGATYWKKGEFTNAIQNYKLGLEINKKLKNYKRMVRSLNSIGASYWNLKNNILALEYYFEALETEKNYAEISSPVILNNIGLLYLHLEDTTLAKKYFIEGVRSAHINKSTLGMGYSFMNFGDLYFKQKHYEKALKNYERAIEYYKKLKDENGIAQILNKIGEVYLVTKRYKLAKKNILEAYKISKINRLRLTQTESLINYCRIQIHQKKGTKVLINLERALRYAEEGNFAESKIKIYKLQSKVYESVKDYKKALIYSRKYEALKDSLFNENSLRILLDAKEKYEAIKREEMNRELQNINNLQKLELKNKKDIMFYTVLGSVFSVFVIFYLVYLNRQRKKQNKALQRAKNEVELINEKLNATNELLLSANSTKDKFFSIISHDLKNPFNTLLGATEILKSDCSEMDEKDRKELIEIISNDTQRLYSLLENLLFWANSQTGKLKAKKTSIFLYQTLFDVYQLFKSSAEKKGIKIIIDVPKSLVILFDEFMFNTIMRNLLSNAIKFTSSGGKIYFYTKEKDGKVHLFIKDEGVGIKEENLEKLFNESSNYKEVGTNNEKGTGLGLILCRDFVKENDAEILVSSELGKGTTFELILERGK